MIRDEAIREARRQADETGENRWIVAPEGTAPHSYHNVEGYEVVAQKPATGTNVYRTTVPSKRYAAGEEPLFSVTGYLGGSIEIRAEFETEAAAIAYGSRFPKSRKVRCVRCYGYSDGMKTVCGVVRLTIYIRPDERNGGVNESAIKRARKFLSEINYRFFEACYSNGDSPEALAAMLGVPTEAVNRK